MVDPIRPVSTDSTTSGGIKTPVDSVRLLIVRPVIDPPRVTALAEPEISVLDSPEPLSVTTLEVPPELVVEHVPVSACVKPGNTVATGVAAITDTRKASLAERRAFIVPALLKSF